MPAAKPPRAKPPAGKTTREQAEELFAELITSIPNDTSADPERWRIHALLAHLVCFHQRENKPVHWAKFERLKMTEEELAEDPDCLAGVRRTTRAPFKEKLSLVFEYSFDPSQETKFRETSKWIAAHDPTVGGEIHALDPVHGTLLLKTTTSYPSKLSMIPDELVPTKTIEESIHRIARAWQATGKLDGALADLLHRSAPKQKDGTLGAPIIVAGVGANDETIKAFEQLDCTTLAIQGPPGAGKTHIGAAAIAQLLSQGFRVGIAAHSHKVVEHLIAAVLRMTRAAKRKLRVVNVDRNKDAAIFDDPDVEHAASVNDAGLGTNTAPQLMGGTAWAFSSSHAAGHFDYLFVDEAGQISLANLVGMSPAAKNLVLLGDHMQLPQPLKGVHPGESRMSALEYLLMKPDGTMHQTIPEGFGIFLPSTYRMHPSICKFISDAIYDGRLEPEPHTAYRVALHGKTKSKRIPIEGGIHFVPVEHEDNVQESEEEVAVIQELIGELRGRSFREKQGAEPRLLCDSDFLVVAPYNRQVNLLKQALPDLRVGTVDLFQGREAPVVILSMCASSADDAPRGLEFLLNRNRMNVAISRAQSLAIIVGSPQLARSRVTSVAQMRLVNLFCRAIAE